MKFKVTPELATLIKTMRMQSELSSKDLAAHIGKSPSYISKLEGGTVKSVQKDELTSILQYISGDADFFEETLPNVVRVLFSFMSMDRLPAQVWLIHYDIHDKKVEVPAAMAKDLRERIEGTHMSLAEIAGCINANMDSELSPSFPANEILSIDCNGENRLLIREEIAESEMQNILDEPGYTTDYNTLYGLVYILFRLSIYGNAPKKMPPELAAEVLRAVDLYMEQFQLRSLIDYSHFLSSEGFIQRQTPLVSSLGTANSDYMSRIIDFFQEATQKDALSTAKVLANFNEMMTWDPAFTIKLLELPFADLADLSYQNKKKLLDEITELLNKYDRMSDLEKKWEQY